MDSLRTIKPIETRLMLRLANSLHTTHDPPVRKQHLLHGLCDLVRGTGGVCIVTQLENGSHHRVVISETRYCSAVECVPPQSEGSAGTTAPFEPLQAIGKSIQTLESTVQLAESAVSATIRLYRSEPSARPFTARAQGLVNLLHDQMSWIYQADVVLISPNAMSLSPRARQTLELLLGGLGEKQIASRLHLSPNTVHHYVKSIHRHFGVSSRSELLARWVGR